MSHSILFCSSTKSIVRQELSDIFFIVTQEDNRKNYRVMPKGFKVHAEPNCPIQFFFGNKLEIL